MPSGLSPIRLATSRRLRSIPRAERLLPTQSAWPPVDLVATYRRVAPRRRPFAREPVPPNRCRQSTRCQAIRAGTRRRRRADAFLGDLDIVAHSGHALRSPPVGGLFIWGRAPGEALRPRGGRARRGRRRHAAPSAAPRYAPCRRRARRPRGGAPRTGASGKGRRSGPQQVRPSAPRPVAAPYPSASNCCTDLCDACVRALADFEPRWCPRTRTTRCARAPASLGGSPETPFPQRKSLIFAFFSDFSQSGSTSSG